MDHNEQIFREIKSRLALKGVPFLGIARDLGVTRQQLWSVAKGREKTQYIREAIVEAIGYNPWGDSNPDN